VTRCTRRSASRASTPSAGPFTQFYGSTGLDAALLLLPRLGFLPADDPRMLGTLAAVERELVEDGFVLRYRVEADPVSEAGTVDGLAGEEGAFLACSFWLADALALAGRRDDAVELFERLLALRNDVGLLAEEWDPRLQRQLGNTPQAFSHLALVGTALALDGSTAHLVEPG
jgi:GH15 family glucan-1,4-alpha-glucosidase